MVLIKIAAILIFVIGAARAVRADNWQPFMPNGFPGVLTGAAIVFFTYIGFDSVSTAAEECRHPQRDLPIGIIATLVVCTVLYIAVALVLTGIADYRTLGNAAPGGRRAEGSGLRQHPALGERRRDRRACCRRCWSFSTGRRGCGLRCRATGCCPRPSRKVHPVHKTPHVSTWMAGLAVGIPAGIWDIGTFADLSNIGTLFAFMLVSAGVIVLRRKQPDRPRAFRVPLVPLASGALHRLLPGPDDEPAAGDLGALLRLAGDRAGDLLPVRQEAQPTSHWPLICPRPARRRNGPFLKPTRWYSAAASLLAAVTVRVAFRHPASVSASSDLRSSS